MFRLLQPLNYSPRSYFHFAALSSYISEICVNDINVCSSTTFPIFSAVCIERTPSFTKTFSNAETCFCQYSNERLTNLSRLSDYEVDKKQVQYLSSEINMKIKGGKSSQKELVRYYLDLY